MTGTSDYDAFISYSHALDGKLAPTLHRELERFAKPWYRMRALRIFRDNANLAANPGLWSAIEEALAASKWLILMASPQAAQSPWVDREVSWWLANRSPRRLLLVVTDGDFGWDDQAQDVNWAASTVIPPALRGAFDEEPRWVDLRWLRDAGLVDQSNPRLRESVADIGAAIRGISKDLLVGEHVRQHRRTMRWVRSAVSTLVVFLVVAMVAAGVAVVQRNEARNQTRISVSRELASRATSDTVFDADLRLLLAIAARRLSDTAESRAALVHTMLRAPSLHVTLPGHTGGVADLSLGPRGDTAVTVDGAGQVRVWDIGDGSLRLGPLPARADLARIDTQGRLVMVDVDGTARWYDGGTGEELATAELGSGGQPLVSTCDAYGCGRLQVDVRTDGEVIASLDPTGALRLTSRDGTVRTADTGQYLTGLRYVPGDHDGNLLFLADSRGVFAWREGIGRLSDYQVSFSGDVGIPPGHSAFSANGRYFGLITADPLDSVGRQVTWYDVTDPTAWSYEGEAYSGVTVDLLPGIEQGPALAGIAIGNFGTSTVSTDPRSGQNPEPRVYSLTSSGDFLNTFRVVPPRVTITRLAMTGEGALLVGGMDSTVEIYRHNESQLLNVHAGSMLDAALPEAPEDVPADPGTPPEDSIADRIPEGAVMSATAPDGRVTAAIYEQAVDTERSWHELRVFNADGEDITPEPLRSVDAVSVAFAQDDGALLIGSARGDVSRIDLARPDDVRTVNLAQGPITELAPSPDGTWLVVRTSTEITLVDAVALTPVATLVTLGTRTTTIGYEALYRAHAISPVVFGWRGDGGTLALGWEDRLAGVSSAPDAELGGPFGDEIRSDVPLLPGSGNDAVVTGPQIVEIRLPGREMLETACSMANRSLSRSEWQTWVSGVPYIEICPDATPVDPGDAEIIPRS